MNPRMNPPRGQSMTPLGSYSPGIRGPLPNTTLGPSSSGPNMPMSMGGMVGRPQWQPNTNTVSNLLLIVILALYNYINYL